MSTRLSHHELNGSSPESGPPGGAVYTCAVATKKKKGGRVTPKGGHKKAVPTNEAGVQASSRYTPPVPEFKKHSAPWVPYVMFALLGLGALIILLYYVGAVPGGRSNWYLALGLSGVLGGLYTATKYH